MTRVHDVVVIGLGAMGSAAVHELACRGVRVLGVDRHAPPHAFGSSHGRTRIIREAYHEHPLYVPFVRRAYDRWAALEAEWDAGPLFRRTGALMIGPADSALVAGATRSAREHAIVHELLSAAEVRTRYPAYRPPEDHVALLERRAGILFPERCIEAQLGLARRAGAELRTGVEVLGWRTSGDGIEVRTATETVLASRVVLAAGPWLPGLLRAQGDEALLPLVVERQLSHWFAPLDPTVVAPERCPIALWEHAPERLFAAFPDLGDGIKCGAHHDGGATDPDTVDRVVSTAEVEQAHALLARLMPSGAGHGLEHRVCLYTNTLDGHFVIDRHPGEPRIVIVSACSGHGFKFSTAIGELVADLAMDRPPALDLSFFSAARFAVDA
ncbi:MAG TPA: N-methyl-L-tryptophan oxidase [Gemmatimonadaceae bacterium]|nr:N-methyl-L-tryptophan oxidase [Gemmatimonadaceae bacterium]